MYSNIQELANWFCGLFCVISDLRMVLKFCVKQRLCSRNHVWLLKPKIFITGSLQKKGVSPKLQILNT